MTLVVGSSCQLQPDTNTATQKVVEPVVVTDPVPFDSDDPAIWINQANPSESLILGTDKGNDTGKGGLYVFTLEGKMDTTRSIYPLNGPNNVDVAYDLQLGNELIDIAVVTVRYDNTLRIFKLPEMTPVDNGGISVFVDETERSPMGIGLYTDSATGTIYAIVSRKFGPKVGYLWQYQLIDSGSGHITGKLVRKFGTFSGKIEIESVAVDNELGYVYCSDETVGVRKYYAHPDSTNQELSLFATTINKEDHEGISIYKEGKKDGYILLSDQQAQQFHLFKRRSANGNEEPVWVKTVPVKALESDGNEVTSVPLGPRFPKGLFVAMSTDRTFHYYNWEDIIKP